VTTPVFDKNILYVEMFYCRFIFYTAYIYILYTFNAEKQYKCLKEGGDDDISQCYPLNKHVAGMMHSIYTGTGYF